MAPKSLLSRCKESPYLSYDGTPCLECQTKANADGYCQIRYEGIMRYCHRVAFVLDSGRELEPGEIVRHRCNNRICCNPRHLMTGSVVDNIQDQKDAGTFDNRTGRKRKLTRQTVQVIRWTLANTSQGINALAGQYAVSRWTIRAIRDNEIWKGVEPINVVKPAFDPFGDVDPFEEA